MKTQELMFLIVIMKKIRTKTMKTNCNNIGKLAVCSLVAICFSCSAAISETLPKSAIKISSTEAKSLYSGKSSNWKKARAYFSPDGRYLIVGKNKKWFAEGTWNTRGNKVCSKSKWTNIKDDKTGRSVNCWTWYKDGKRYLSLWSGDKNGKHGYYDGEHKKMRKGDRVSKTFNKLKAKYNKG
jgi:hypothetical protein